MSAAPQVLPRVSTGPASEDFTLREAARDGYHRLALITGLVAGATLLLALVLGVEHALGESQIGRVAAAGLAATFLFSAGLSVACRRGLFPDRAFVQVALAIEVGVAVALGGSILGWQHRLSGDAVAWLLEGGPQPLTLGAGMVPWTGLWILLFASYVPLRPRQHLVGAALAVTTLALWPVASALALGFPPNLQDRALEITAHVGIWLSFRGAVAAAIAYFAAGCVYSLRRDLATAERLGSYQLTEELGHGGMGEVWRAEHCMLARPAAIKLIRSSLLEDNGRWEEMRLRFEREVQATARLRSPHTIEIYDFGVTGDGTFYYVMELLDGLDLNELVKKHGPLPWRRVVHVLLQACHSLGEAHEMGLVHRDIKPANILLCRVGRDVDQVKVLDFGLVKSMEARDATLTHHGAFMGTPAFASPESVTEGSDAADPRSDIYSLGCVAFWLLTGRGVFDADTPMDMVVKHARDEPQPPSLFSEEEIPSDLDALVLECLAKRVDDRPTSVDEIAYRLTAFQTSKPWSREEALRWWEMHYPQAPRLTSREARPADA